MFPPLIRLSSGGHVRTTSARVDERGVRQDSVIDKKVLKIISELILHSRRLISVSLYLILNYSLHQQSPGGRYKQTRQNCLAKKWLWPVVPSERHQQH